MACGDFSETFPNSFEKNWEIVTNYRFVVPHGSLKELNLDTIGIEVLNNKVSDSKVPVIVTAASANHFEEVQGLIEMLMTRYKGFKLIFYDIGLESNQVSVIKRHCKCEFRRFPFSKYPEYFRILRNYVWKPLIIQLVLIEYDFVMWMDASVRLNGSPLEELFEEARKTGIKILRGYGLIVKQTHLNTFKALEEKPCMFQGQELQTTWIIVSRTNFTLRAIMKPWVSCALQYGCMAQDNAERLYRGRSTLTKISGLWQTIAANLPQVCSKLAATICCKLAASSEFVCKLVFWQTNCGNFAAKCRTVFGLMHLFCGKLAASLQQTCRKLIIMYIHS
ncbi:hypothetical protein FSP39_024018 [Pinctada imbricata]|uniref:Uncharacterized protein n=1 Tax=Pinctada imbricata TaxID=66713 RepID=A0AA88Y6T0_PINIB|nr:hypothetical protein FSP39_024018 [Pinctada imbricata]